jgi:integrase
LESISDQDKNLKPQTVYNTHENADNCERSAAGLRRQPRRDDLTSPQVGAFLHQAQYAHMHLPLLIGLWTGRREGDVLRLKWSA